MTQIRPRPCPLCGMFTRSGSGICHRHNVVRDPLVCMCDRPTPDEIGECQACRRRVVTFVHPSLWSRYRTQYPDQWARAVALRLRPDDWTRNTARQLRPEGSP